MARRTSALLLGLAIATTGACKKGDKKERADRPAPARDAAAAPVVPDATAAPVEPAMPADALDKLLAERKIAADAVAHAGGNASSTWAVVVSKRNDVDEPSEYTVLRITKAGVTETTLTPPAGGWWSAVTDLEARDLDGDGADDAILQVEWNRLVSVTLPGKCETTCWVQTSEVANDLHLLGGEDKLQDGFAHVIRYETSTTAAEDISDYADPEKLEYSWAVLPDSKPPMVKLTRTTLEVAKDRIAGLLDPAKLPAGEAKEIAAAF